MYKVESAHSKDSSFQITSKDYEYYVDIKEQGIAPVYTLLA